MSAAPSDHVIDLPDDLADFKHFLWFIHAEYVNRLVTYVRKSDGIAVPWMWRNSTRSHGP